MRIAAIAAVGLVLTGCSSTGMGRAMSYDRTVHQVVMEDDTYRIFEHPTDNTLMTTPSLATGYGQGLVAGATLGLAASAVQTPEQRHEAAARRRLDTTGRENCQITSGYLVLHGQYEFTYECPS
jgi:hypothetical protein